MTEHASLDQAAETVASLRGAVLKSVSGAWYFTNDEPDERDTLAVHLYFEGGGVLRLDPGADGECLRVASDEQTYPDPRKGEEGWYQVSLENRTPWSDVVGSALTNFELLPVVSGVTAVLLAFASEGFVCFWNYCDVGTILRNERPPTDETDGAVWICP